MAKSRTYGSKQEKVYERVNITKLRSGLKLNQEHVKRQYNVDKKRNISQEASLHRCSHMQR